MSVVDQSTPLTEVVATSAAPLGRDRDVHTVGDLLRYLPRRYLDSRCDLSELADGANVVFVGQVKDAVTRPMRQRKGRMLTATVTDGSHEITLTFFKAYGHEGKLLPGAVGLFAGTVSRYKSQWQLTHPAYEMFEPDQAGGMAEAFARPLIPVYLPATKMPSWNVVKMVRVVLDSLDHVDDPVPAEVRRRRRLGDLLESYRLVHQPHSRADVERGRRRLRYDEAFTVQTVLAQRRKAADDLRTTPRRPRPGGLLDAFDARLPFTLTAGQHEVAATLAAELAREAPMHRLLQGEVGSGKTVVALRAMLAVIDSGGQAAMLAPTEVLAAQHHRSITAMMGDLAQGGMLGGSEIGTRVTLLTGSQAAGTRRRALLEAASGEAGIVIGTHALIQEHVSFADLGLVVVDEQHRFGVEQRDALRAKGKTPPHVLVMTATPIPRTVAMTVFGDMETSTLSELPAGRSPITSHVVPGAKPHWVRRTWERVAEEVRRGHQVYVVCPRIGDDGNDGDAGNGGSPGTGLDEEEWSEPAPEEDGSGPPPAATEPRSVLAVEAELRAEPALAGLRIAVLHGRMGAEEKDATMRAFTQGAIDVLVATTVIEVGVDVANATVMVIVDADRFGVSQLHQLRGRVGRGSAPGLCLLMTGAEQGPARERLDAVAATTDGFALAQLDLETRREGDVLGARQSGGRSQLQLLSLLRDERLILEARQDATEVVAQDPRLERHPVLRALVESALDEEQAAYLERG